MISVDNRPELEARLDQAIVSPSASVSEALKTLDDGGFGVVVVATSDRRLVGVLSDGDLRRHLMSAAPLTIPCASIATRDPLVARPGMTDIEVLQIMDCARDYTVDHLPIVTDDGIVVGLVLRRDLVTVDERPFSAVVMAGGLGTRLRPLTDATPKPMLPVGDRPLLERTIERLRMSGIRQVSVTTHYLGDRISDHFGDGRNFGVEMHYVAEDRPLGTAGSLRLMEPPRGPFLVVNGDILTGLDFQDLIAYHRETGAVATVGVRKFELQVPYGVVDCKGPIVLGLREKPVQQFLVNAGVYLLEPSVMSYIPSHIPAGQRFDMTDLIQRLLNAGKQVVGFPITEYWLDIGQPADYARAQEDLRTAQV